jgi:hypothetical protein
MSIRRHICIIFCALLVEFSGGAQTPAPAIQRSIMNMATLPSPPVPSDPLELVTAGAQPIQDADQRAAVTQLLTNAHSLSNVRAQPYDLKTTFSSFGGSASDGTWSLEDVSPGRNVYRWTAQGPNYSGVNLYTDSRYYVTDPAATIPLRLAQVRETIFFTTPPTGPYAALRTAAGYLNGTALQCVLVGFGGGQATPQSSGRDWKEAEYCVDPKSGLLMTYSPVPGLYVRYDYSQASQFHGHTIPGSFIITQAGKTVIEAKTESVTEPPATSSPLFQPAGLKVAGVGAVMTPASRMFSRIFPPKLMDNPRVDVVVLHSVTSASSQTNELEVLLSTSPAANQQALDRLKQAAGPIGATSQPGATPQSHEAFYTLEVLSAAN